MWPTLPPGMSKTPYGWPTSAPAFYDFSLFAIEDAECRCAFFKETGKSLDEIANATQLERLIDEATGHTNTVISAFLDWLVVNHWGEDLG